MLIYKEQNSLWGRLPTSRKGLLITYTGFNHLKLCAVTVVSADRYFWYITAKLNHCIGPEAGMRESL